MNCKGLLIENKEIICQCNFIGICGYQMAQERHWKVLEQKEGEVIYSEDWIRNNYFPYWSQEMIRQGKESEITFDSCLEDWIIVNWAEEIRP